MAKIAEIIKYEGDNSTFIWKHPSEDFNSLTQLIVHESQEAIFFMNGQALDLFGPGRYTLETQNIPLLGEALNQTVRGKTPFHCEVYFINKTVHMGLKWGTDSRVHFVDPLTGLPLDIGASGEINLQVQDSRKLIVKLVGTGTGLSSAEANAKNRGIGLQTRPLQNYFRAPLMTQVKSFLSAAIRGQNINILEADSHLDAISQALKQRIEPAFADFGLTVSQFYVTTLSLPEDDKNFRDMKALISQAYLSVKAEQVKADVAEATQRRKLIEEQTEAQIRILRAQSEATATKAQGLAEAEVMRAKGYSERDVLQADVQKVYAEGLGNMTISGSGAGVAGDMIGLGVGMAAAGAVSGQMGEMFKGLTMEQPAIKKTTCPNCNSDVPENSKFCLECGTRIEILTKNEAICPTCGKKTAKGKFCIECGALLVAKCAKCGAELPTGAKFCLECGERR